MNEITFDEVVNNDKVLHFYLREGSLLNNFSFGSRLDLRVWAFKEAFRIYLDKKYQTGN